MLRVIWCTRSELFMKLVFGIKIRGIQLARKKNISLAVFQKMIAQHCVFKKLQNKSFKKKKREKINKLSRIVFII